MPQTLDSDKPADVLEPAGKSAFGDGVSPDPATAGKPALVPAPRGPRFQYRVPRGFEWNRYELPIAALPPQLEGLRIAQITDLHFRKFWSPVYDQLLARVAAEQPDLILLTGDFVDNKRNHLPAVPTVQRFLGALRARIGCFGILGNHDRYALAPRLQGSPITLLDGKTHRIAIDGAELELLGLPGVERRDLTRQVIESYPNRQFAVPRLILSHFPDQLHKTVELMPDIYFSGHTHGGQMCLPGGYPIIRHDSLPRRFCRGVHRAANTWLVVSRGLGFTGLPFRVFCPSEVIEITLTRG